VLGTVAAVGWSRGRTTATAPCADAGHEIDAIWNPEIAASVRARFRETGRAYAGATADRTLAAIDTYADRWRYMRRDACVATSVRREQSEAMLDLRMQCLDRRADELHAMISLFAANADVRVVDHAVQAVRDLPAMAACADRAALADAVPPPSGKAAAISSVRARLDQAKARDRAGAYDDELAAMPSIVADARATGYPALLADALATDGGVLVHAGKAADAVAPLREAARAAALAHDDAQSTRAWRLLVRASALDGHPDVALAVFPAADAAVARGGDDPIAAARLLVAIEPARAAMGDDAGARAAAEQAVALYERAHAPPLERADGQVALARTLAHAGDYAGARAAGEQALALYSEELGPEHPDVAGVLMNLGGLDYDIDDYTAAEAHLRRSLAIREKALGPDHPDTGRALDMLAEVLRVQARFDEARPLAERSLAIKIASLGADHPDVANSLTTVGALAMEAGDLAAARRDHTRALEVREKALGPDNPAVADSLVFLGDLEETEGNLAAARADYQRAIAIFRRGTAGPRPEIARPLIALAKNDLAAGRLDDVVAHGREAISIIEKTAGPDTLTIADAIEPVTDALLRQSKFDEALASATRWAGAVEHADARYQVGPLADQAEALRGLHRIGDSVPLLERALAIALDQDRRRAEPLTALEVSGVRFALARALWDSHGDRVRARQLAAAARADLDRAVDDANIASDRAEIDAWLAARR
jgi:tetratricopeptide (TPR) repeat protein